MGTTNVNVEGKKKKTPEINIYSPTPLKKKKENTINEGKLYIYKRKNKLYKEWNHHGVCKH